MPSKNTLINYIEFKTKDLEKTKTFYATIFGWQFTDYGPTYIGFSSVSSGIEGGFKITDKEIVNGILVILYHQDLEYIKSKIILNKGIITQDIFSFPGGKRFHFLDPSGNELAVWCNL